MSLVSLSELLPHAQQYKYGIGAFNVVDFEMILSIIAAAENECAPVIIQYAENDDTRIPIEAIGEFARKHIEKAAVPICLHLDHGKTLSGIARAIQAGFSSVMIDASDLPFEENVEWTKKVVEFAHACKVSVEAEIGSMTQADSKAYQTDAGIDFSDTFTDPNVAERFATETQADAIAVSFGTVHGIYAEKPCLDYQRLTQLAQKVKQPLVVHGGSGLKDEEYQQMIAAGISKINYYSATSYQVTSQIVEELSINLQAGNPVFLQDAVDLELKLVKESLIEKIKLFGSSGRSNLKNN